MIRCYRCGTPAIQMPDGTVERACGCYQPSLICAYPPVMNESTISMPLHKCPLCGDLVFSLLYHRCKGIGSVPTPEPESEAQSEPSEIDVERAKRIYAMIADQIIVHRENCIGCQMLGRPCIEIIPVIDNQEKWKKKAGIS